MLELEHKTEILEPAPSLSPHEAPVEGIWVFPTIKITVIRQVLMNCGLTIKINMREKPQGAGRSWMHFVCVCFCMFGREKP